MYITFHSADLVLLKTSDNLKYIPKRYHYKCKVSIGVGVSEEVLNQRRVERKSANSFKILSAGRLEYWKGTHLAIQAYAELLKVHPTATYTIVGAGSEEGWFKEIAASLNVLDKIEWLPMVSQEKFFKMYEEYDLFLFPSMHDSSGLVAVEALSFSLPVVCLDLGGPKEFIDESCGNVIPTRGLTEQEVVTKIANALTYLASNPVVLDEKKSNALYRAGSFSWNAVVMRNYQLIENKLNIGLQIKPSLYASEN